MPNDKLPALPPRPIRISGAAFFYEEQVAAYMDAQDARIAELGLEVDKWFQRCKDAEQAHRDSVQCIAELDWEIREARELLENAVSPYMTWDHKHRDWNNARRNWRERNAERENGQ